MDNNFLPAYIGLGLLYLHVDKGEDVSEGINALAEATYFLDNQPLQFQHAVLLLRNKKFREAHKILNQVIAHTL